MYWVIKYIYNMSEHIMTQWHITYIMWWRSTEKRLNVLLIYSLSTFFQYKINELHSSQDLIIKTSGEKLPKSISRRKQKFMARILSYRYIPYADAFLRLVSRANYVHAHCFKDYDISSCSSENVYAKIYFFTSLEQFYSSVLNSQSIMVNWAI